MEYDSESNYSLAAHWLIRAIDQAAKETVSQPEDPTTYRGAQLALARYHLGVLLMDGHGIEKNPGRAFALFRHASDHDCAFATNKLARMYHQGAGVPRDDAAAVKLYEAAASAGVGSAAADLANGYVTGWAGERSKELALNWYRRSAALGFSGAWVALGRAYEEAAGLVRDNNEALTWYQLAGNSNVVEAQLRLGDIARFAQLDQPRNDQVALRWYRLAADQGNALAEEKIGDLYWQGSSDLARNRAEAVHHYGIAAAQGIASAGRKLAIAYANGDGAPADDARMLHWQRKAAESGDPVAAGMLGYAIMIGLDGTYDLVEAATWLTLAAENSRSGEWGVHAAVYSRDAQSKLTPPEQVAFHARLARWRSALDGE
jgi:TPR repeat protein